MEIAVINGSPKGESSVTRQYIAYLEKVFPGNKYEIINVGKNIKKLENDEKLFQETLKVIVNKDAIIWCYPVYVLLVPYQLKRYIELIFEREATGIFSGKYASSITTSVHFYDHTALNYMHQISCDLGMIYCEGYSADMNDLLIHEKRNELKLFFTDFMNCVQNKLFIEKKYENVQPTTVKYIAPVFSVDKDNNLANYNDLGKGDVEKTIQNEKKVVLLSDYHKDDNNLASMVDVFKNYLQVDVEEININDLGLKGGCLGCMNCAYDGTCVYNDGFGELYHDKLLPAQAIIYALNTKDRFFSSKIKLFMDRSFCNGHRPVAMGKQTGFIISGPLRQLPNLRQIIEAYANVGQTNLVGVVTDEYSESTQITELLKSFALRLNWAIDNKAAGSTTFLGKGGHLVFRDLIYNMRGYFRADHLFYRDHKLYDYPHGKLKMRALNACLGLAMKVPRVRKMVYRESIEGMIRPHRNVIENEYT